MVSNLPFGSGVYRSSMSSQAHLAHVSTLSGRAVPVSGRLSGTTSGGADHHAPVSRCLSAAGVRFLGHPVPAGELGLPHGRPTGACAPDPNGVSTFHTSEIRPGWVPPIPRGRRCPPDWRSISPTGACRFSTASPAPRCNNPSAGLTMTRHHRGFTRVHPSGLPLACSSRMEREPLGFYPGFAPRRYRRRTSGRGQAIGHWPGTTLSTSDLLSAYSLNPCDLVSHPGPGLLRRLRPVPARSADGGPSPHTAPDARLKAGPRRFPRSLADLLTKEEPGYAPAASHGYPAALHRGLPGRRRKTHQKVPRPKEEAETHRTRPRSARFEPVSTKEA